MKSLVVGMGIGGLYKTILEKLNHTVITVDLHKDADYNDVTKVLRDHNFFDCVFICTPNYTHEELAYIISNNARIVFIEKPGLKTPNKWNKLVSMYPNTRFMMVKNNQYRSEIPFFKTLAESSESIEIHWINKNRIPNAGGWFTNKELSFGGVSRDLMPHLLSIITTLFPDDFRHSDILRNNKKQNWKLSDISSSDYGIVNQNGTYNVDDHAEIFLKVCEKECKLVADWKSDFEDDQSIIFNMKDRSRKFNLGLCPEYAYSKMITEALANLNDVYWWDQQYIQDLWIHKMVE